MMRKKGKGTVYRIVVRSELGDRHASAFEGMRMETEDGRTILTGEVKDQPHLFGILDRLRGLGLELISVQALSEDARSIAEGIESQSPERVP
jgi:outer membrane PBP1 activator LpoA protein